MTQTATEPLIRKIDRLQIPVPDLEAGLAFYRDRLGHQLIWRTRASAGLRMPDSDAELVIQVERSELEANLLVTSADSAVFSTDRFVLIEVLPCRAASERRRAGHRLRRLPR
jgi:catechol 2,3-dioxygenase-like lactoylglutathione lyase family enzyme